MARWIKDVAAVEAAAAAEVRDVVGWMVLRKAPEVEKMERAWDCVPLSSMLVGIKG